MSCCCAERARHAMVSLGYRFADGIWYDPTGKFVIRDEEVDARHVELLPIAVRAVFAGTGRKVGRTWSRLFA